VLWPPPDDVDGDLNAVAGPTWLDDAASTAWARLRAADDLPIVVGHGDWYTDNLRWDGDRLRVAYDWDSVIAAPEADIAGFAAGIYPTNEPGGEATLTETAAFLSAYEQAKGRVLSDTEHERFWAAGLWVRSFDAKKQALRGEPVTTLTRDEAIQRRSRIRR
jgi:aminoglycoside phosphotransferase (APT) family kinase protein